MLGKTHKLLQNANILAAIASAEPGAQDIQDKWKPAQPPVADHTALSYLQNIVEVLHILCN